MTPASVRKSATRAVADTGSGSGRRLLLDTHIFLRAATEPERLSAAARDAIEQPENEVYLSAAAVWEIVLKHSLGKLRLPSNPVSFVPAILDQLGFRSLAITSDHALTLGLLPEFHRDPFDRIMIAQAKCEGMTLVSTDRDVMRYSIQFLMGM